MFMNSGLRTIDHVLVLHFKNQKWNPGKIEIYLSKVTQQGNSRAGIQTSCTPRDFKVLSPTVL